MKFHPAADDVKPFAEVLIRQHHRHLVGVRIEYVFSEDVTTSKGKEVWAVMRKVSGLSAFLATTRRYSEVEDAEKDNAPFFVLTIAHPVWQVLNEAQRMALVDHELSHAMVEDTDDGGERLTIVGHDLEEFAAVVRRHGLWRPDLTHFFRATGQLEMFRTAVASEQA